MSDLVFISYSNADSGVADAICSELERAGIRCWIAPRDITPGRMWSEAIIDGINASRVMILVHSRHSNRSPQCVREVERAVNRRMLLLQVRLQDIKPSRALELFIASSQWLNAFPKPIDSYLSSLPQLVRNLLAEAVETGEHTAERTVNEAPSPIAAIAGTRMSRRNVVSIAAALGIVALVGVWSLTQKNRGDGAPTAPIAPESLPRNSVVDTSVDSVTNAPKEPKTTPRDGGRVKVGDGARVAERDPVGTSVKPIQDSAKVPATQPVSPASVKESAPLPALTDALAGNKASDCMQAIATHDAAWLRAHYGSPLTVTDAANLKHLESMFGKREYRATPLELAKFAGNAVNFSMRVGYQGGFGPRLSVDVPFEVRMVNDQPHGEVATCRARGVLKSP